MNAPEGQAWCSDHQRYHPVEEFQRNRSKPSGLQSVCKEAFKRRYYNYDRKTSRALQVKKYGLSWESYLALLRKQRYCCRICGQRIQAIGAMNGQRGERTGACADHDHDSGEVRGLLCHGCNGGIGYFKDDLNILRRAVAYLENQ